MVWHQAVLEKVMWLQEGVIVKQAGRGSSASGAVTWPRFDVPEMPLSSPSPNQRHMNYRKGKTERDCQKSLCVFTQVFLNRWGKLGWSCEPSLHKEPLASTKPCPAPGSAFETESELPDSALLHSGHKGLPERGPRRRIWTPAWTPARPPRAEAGHRCCANRASLRDVTLHPRRRNAWPRAGWRRQCVHNENPR